MVSFEYNVDPKIKKIDSKGNKFYLFTLFISGKSKSDLNDIQKVVYLLPPSFDPPNVASEDREAEFSIQLEALGGFYVMAVILKNTGEKLKFNQYLPKGSVSNDPSIMLTDPATYWTDFGMKQAQKWTGLEENLFRSE